MAVASKMTCKIGFKWRHMKTLYSQHLRLYFDIVVIPYASMYMCHMYSPLQFIYDTLEIPKAMYQYIHSLTNRNVHNSSQGHLYEMTIYRYRYHWNGSSGILEIDTFFKESQLGAFCL